MSSVYKEGFYVLLEESNGIDFESRVNIIGIYSTYEDAIQELKPNRLVKGPYEVKNRKFNISYPESPIYYPKPESTMGSVYPSYPDINPFYQISTNPFLQTQLNSDEEYKSPPPYNPELFK